MQTNRLPIRILLVEDDEEDVLLVRHLLASISIQNYELDWVADGPAALDALARTAFDLCLLDYRLGLDSGLDLLRKVRATGCGVPVILLTGYGDHELDLQSMQAGASDYLNKNEISPSLLERSIRYAMDRAQVNETLRKAKSRLEERVRERTKELVQANEALRESELFSRSTLDALSAHIAILDEQGFILCTNASWNRFAQSNGLAGYGFEGLNYLSVCDRAEGEWADEAPVVASGIREVLSGRQDLFELEYPCHSPAEKRWFSVRVTRFQDHERPRAVLAHENITERKRAEEILREREEIYRAIVDQAAEGIVLIDPETLRFVEFNDAACQGLGYSREEFADLALFDIQGTLTPEEVRKRLEKLVSSGQGLFENRQRRKDGTLRDMLISNRVIGLRGRNYLTGIWQEITDRKQAEEEREAVVEFLHLVNESKDTEELIHAATDFFQRRSGCEAVGIRLGRERDYPYYETRGFPAEFVRLEDRLCAQDGNGQPIFDSTGNPVLACMCGNVICGRFDPSKPFFTARGSFWTNSTTELLLTSTEADRQARTRNRCNGEGYESVALIALRFGEEPLGLLQLNDKRRDRFTPKSMGFWERLADYMGVALSKLRAEEALRESEAQFKAMFEIASIGMAQADPRTGQWLRVNEKMCEITGYSAREMLLMRIPDITHPEDRERDWKAFQNVIESTWKDYRLEKRYIRKDGAIVWVNVNVTVIRDASGKPLRSMATIEDISERKRSEEALRSSRAFFDAVIEQSPISMWISDEAGTLMRTNQALRDRFCVSDEEVVGKYNILKDNLVEEQGLMPLVRKVFERGETVRFAIDYDTSRLQNLELERSKIATFDVTISAVLDSGGTVTNVIVQHQDVSEQKEAEKALREAHKHLDQILEFFPDATFGIDCRGKVTHWNRAIEKMTGVSKAEMLQKGDYEYALPFYGTRRPILVDVALAMGLDTEVEARGYDIIQSEGDTILGEAYVSEPFGGEGAYLSATACVLRDSSGKVTGALESIRDITAHRKMEESLRESEAQLRQIIDLVPHKIFVKDRDGKYLLANRAVAEGYNTSVGALEGKRHIDFHPDENELRRMLQDDREVMEKGETKVIREEPYTDARGNLRFLQTTKVPFHTLSNKTRAVLGVAVDITEQKRAEEEREKLHAQLLQAQKMESVGRLAGGVAHDFNNMLGIILGHTEMALDDVAPSQALFTDLVEIRKAAERSANLTRQLLAFARKQTIAPKVLDLNETVEGMLKMLRRLIGEDIDLVWLPGAGLWPVKVDPSQIDQVLANLCVNARDAITGVGKITIETKNVALDETYCANHPGFIAGDFVLLAVSDNGCGMDQETLCKLFEPFFTTKGVGKGTGLGLATVYGIVKQNNGFINVYSEPSRGTTFKVYLPRYSGLGSGDSQTSAVEIPKGRGETVLLVEDEAAILGMTAKILDRQGYTVLTATTPGKAMRLAREHTGEIHLLVTDVIMPERNGQELAKELVSLYPNLKSLFMSGYTANVIAHQGVLDPGVHFIQKPFSKLELAAKVREVLDT